MKEPERAIAAYEAALRHNPYSEQTLTLVAALCRSTEKYAKVYYFYLGRRLFSTYLKDSR